MKKTLKIFVSMLSSAVLSVSSLPLFSFAEGNITGDFNGDGIADSDDADLILQYYAESLTGINTLDESILENIIKYGDMNGDGEINALDASYIMTSVMNIDFNQDGILNADDINSMLDYYAETMTGNITLDESILENIIKYGDMNSDGEINSLDTSYVTGIAMKTLDVNGDGLIDIDDAMYIYDFAMNIDSYSESEIESLTKLTANVSYYPDIETMKKSLLGYSSDLANTLSGFETGDVNGDGKINASDSSDILVFYAEMSSGKDADKDSEEYKLIHLLGDTDNDGIVNASESSNILSVYAQISSGAEF